MTAPPSIEPGRWLKHFRALADLDRERAAAVLVLSDVRSRIATAKTFAKRDGCDLNAMRILDGLTRLSEAEASERMQNLQHYLAWAALPIGGQSTMLFTHPTARDVREHDEWLAEQDGRAAAAMGLNREQCPYESDSKHGQRWYAGWDSYEAPPVATPAPPPQAATTAPRRGRGRPKGSRNRPKANVVANRLRQADAALAIDA